MRVSPQVQYCLGIWSGIWWGASLNTKENGAEAGRSLRTKKGLGKG